MSNLNSLWMGLLGLGLGQTLPALAEQSMPMATPAAVVSLLEAQFLSDRPIAAPHIRLAQTVAAPTKSPQASAAQSLTQWAEHHRCGAPAAGLQAQPTNRYEMAVLLASCLDALGDRPLNSQEQSAIKTLRSEFKLELAALQDSQSNLIRLRQSIDSSSGTPTSSSPSIRWVRGLDQDSLIRRQENVVQGSSSSLGIKAEANLGKVGVFGRYSVAAGTPLNLPDGGAALTRNDLDLTSGLKDRGFQNWSAGIGIRGFIIPKSVLTLSAGRTFANPLGQLDSNNYGAFYQFPIGDHLTLSPSVVIISNPTNPSNPDIQGAIQASFSF